MVHVLGFLKWGEGHVLSLGADGRTRDGYVCVGESQWLLVSLRPRFRARPSNSRGLDW